VARQSARNEELRRRVNLASGAIRAGSRSPGAASDGLARGLHGALELRRQSVVPVNQPLALISQAQRSGGTLLARLFDGHPQCHVHPHELHIGDKRPHVWPELPLDGQPETWFAKLQEEQLSHLFAKGRREVPLKKQPSRPGERYYPFILPPAFQRRLFLDEVERRSPVNSEREILDCYMTSLFNAWLDNQNLRGPDKRWVVAFSPRRAWGARLDELFEIYPDGRLISILRDPLGWYASALGRSPAADPEELLDLWNRSVSEMLEARGRYRERVSIVRFEGLVLDTEAAMRGLADFLRIDFDPQLTTPTFNRHPTGANSSYEVHGTGIVSDPVERHSELLSAEQRELVRRHCEEPYRKALALLGESDRLSASV
jgi:hypothetical protein